MSYVASTLQSGEQVTAVAHRHWIIYVRPLTWAATGLVSMMIGIPLVSEPARAGMGGALALGGLVVIVVALLSVVAVWFDNWITELAVTNRRVIYKTGFISRRTAEMNMGKIETVIVDQSILGRLLGYGTIHVKGTGQSIENLRSIRAPIAVRDSIAAG